ncbi:LacI family DNA-binding transcriptional regulator [Frondihabitans cladoniiphilus]|uniref:HTH lacI-type domain-containing protein n=1 Tax=Frondihabitans cladoniiphilus TaxID=715785 RepID=A0ABP8VKR4_9MICO
MDVPGITPSTHGSPRTEQPRSHSTPVRPTVFDVAAAAGVSAQTVSRVVNEREHVRPEVRRSVLAAIARLGYEPNAAAQALAARRHRHGREHE